jgi:hypothetical protein
VGCENSIAALSCVKGVINRSRGARVFVDESIEASAADDRAVTRLRSRPGVGGHKVEAAMRPVLVVVLDVFAEHAPEVATTLDQGPVETFAPHRTDETFSEGVGLRVWGAKTRVTSLTSAFAR